LILRHYADIIIIVIIFIHYAAPLFSRYAVTDTRRHYAATPLPRHAATPTPRRFADVDGAARHLIVAYCHVSRHAPRFASLAPPLPIFFIYAIFALCCRRHATPDA